MKSFLTNISALYLSALYCIGFSGCSDIKDYSAHFHNYIQLSVEGSSAISENDTIPIRINVLLATTLPKDETIAFELVDNTGQALTLEQNEILLKAGTKQAQVHVFANRKNMLKQQQTVTLRVKSFSDPDMKPWNQVALTVKPDNGIPQLTAQQQKLLASYKEKWGLDLRRFLGRLTCTTVVTFNSADKGVLYDDKDVKTYQGTTAVTLSEFATSDRPVLKMISNPLGMASFLWEMLQRCTVKNETWNSEFNPEPSDILKAIGYQENKETFSVALDSIEVLPQEHKVRFLKPVMTSPGSKEQDIEPTVKMVVPFIYTFSAWERFKQLAASNTTYLTKEGEKPVEKYLKDAPEPYRINPIYQLTYSNLDTDEWEDDTSIGYLPCESAYDMDKGVWNFAFSWDCQISAGGYTHIRCTYALQNPE